MSREKQQQHYRADGVRITHDPYATGMAEKYGQPGETDNEGFDPYAGLPRHLSVKITTKTPTVIVSIWRGLCGMAYLSARVVVSGPGSL